MKADIVSLQETHAPSHSSIQSWFRNSGFYVASSSVSNKRCGTAILVRHVFSITQVKRDDEGQFLQVEVDGQKLRFVSLYAPIRNPSRNTFFASVPDFVDLAYPKGDIFERSPGVWKFNTSLLEEPNYLSLVRSFWSFSKTQQTSLLFSSPLDWWDQGKFYLREITCCYAHNRAAEQSRENLQLSKRLKQLQRLFDGSDSAAFSALCAIQEELRGIHQHEARASQGPFSLSLGRGRRNIFSLLSKPGKETPGQAGHAQYL
jgi:hypothetical protein